MPAPKDPQKREEWIRKNREKHIGKPSAFKGKTHSKESNERNRLAHLGKATRKGMKNTPEHNQKVSNKLKGKPSPFKNKKHTEHSNELNRLAHLGKLHTEEWKKQRSIDTTGERNPFYGKEHNDKTKCEISNANLGKVPWIKGKTHDEKTRALIRESRLKQVFPQEDTKPERIMQKALLYRNVEYEKHFPVLGQPDVFIKPNLCVFIDGDATHGNPRYYGINDKIAFGVIAKDRWIKDQSITMKLIKSGYKVLRIWQDDIETDADKCVQFIQYFIQNFLKIQESLPLLS